MGGHKATATKVTEIIAVMTAVVAAAVSGLGFFYHTQGAPVLTQNVFGDTVRLYGDGIYANDSYFFAPVFRGADLTILAVAIPALICGIVSYKRKDSMRAKVFLVSVLGIFLYHAASISFGAMYNVLHILYILLFALSFFGVMILLADIYETRHLLSINPGFKLRGLKIMLVFTGIALIAAWLPDICMSFAEMRPPAALKVYHTSVTNVLDIGIIGPSALGAFYLIRRGNIFGTVVAAMIMVLGTYIGIMVVSQSYFQYAAGIELPVAALLTKAASFVMLSFFSCYFAVKIFRNIIVRG